MPYFVYILRTSSNTLYIGQTNNLEKRLKEHKLKKSKGAKYMKYFESFELVYQEEYATLLEVMRREKQLKGWSKLKKEALISFVPILTLFMKKIFRNKPNNPPNFFDGL